MAKSTGEAYHLSRVHSKAPHHEVVRLKRVSQLAGGAMHKTHRSRNCIFNKHAPDSSMVLNTIAYTLRPWTCLVITRYRRNGNMQLPCCWGSSSSCYRDPSTIPYQEPASRNGPWPREALKSSASFCQVFARSALNNFGSVSAPKQSRIEGLSAGQMLGEMP